MRHDQVPNPADKARSVGVPVIVVLMGVFPVVVVFILVRVSVVARTSPPAHCPAASAPWCW